MRKRYVGVLAGVVTVATLSAIAPVINSEIHVSRLADEIRVLLAGHLKPLPRVDYLTAIGFVPNEDQLELGRQLFSDPILGRNNDVSCATCHLSNHGFAEGTALPVGALGVGGPNGFTVGKRFAEGEISTERQCGDDGLGFICDRVMFRNPPSTINTAYRINRANNSGLLLDGRFGKLDFQALLPIHTAEELCGANNLPLDENASPFREGGPLFKSPVLISHSNVYDQFSGADLLGFNASPEEIKGVKAYRPNGSNSPPTRNECLAIAVAKVRSVPAYRKLFKAAFGDEQVTDLRIGSALAAYISTHVSRNTPYDRFVSGRDALTERQLHGMAIFFGRRGEEIQLTNLDKGVKLRGAACFECHSSPTFGGERFASLGVVSDPRSSQSRPLVMFSNENSTGNGFVHTLRLQRGYLPGCHVDRRSATRTYAPDPGHAMVSMKVEDCFKFRVPPLRNVIETFPYFHHGTARGQSKAARNFQERSLLALRQVIEYHLRGPVHAASLNNLSQEKFFDPYYQLDPWVPIEFQRFSATEADEAKFPLRLTDYEIEALLDFVAFGLQDPDAVVKGELGNDISHPSAVLSGFSPSITRDHGTQLELPPAGEFEP